jgi:hypothetical protein
MERKPKRKLRHNAATYLEESARDAEMRAALKAAVRLVKITKGGGHYNALAQARTIVRAELLARWAAMDARREPSHAALPPHIVRLSPEEVKEIERQGGVLMPSKTDTGEPA